MTLDFTPSNAAEIREAANDAFYAAYETQHVQTWQPDDAVLQEFRWVEEWKQSGSRGVLVSLRAWQKAHPYAMAAMWVSAYLPFAVYWWIR